jgi:adenosine deaminase
VTLNTDNRLMSGTTVTEEYWRAHSHLGFTWEELCRIALYGFESAFLPHHEKVALLEAVTEEIRELTRRGEREDEGEGASRLEAARG